MVYPNQAYGPAASLKVYIKQIGWSVGDKGQICDHLMCVWTIHKVTFSFIFHGISDAWDKVVADAEKAHLGMSSRKFLKI